MQELQKTHLDNLTIREKNKLFRQILNNLRLPVLLDERKSIQKEIIDEKNSEISNNLLKKYSKISEEIKIIQNKDIEFCSSEVHVLFVIEVKKKCLCQILKLKKIILKNR